MLDKETRQNNLKKAIKERLEKSLLDTLVEQGTLEKSRWDYWAIVGTKLRLANQDDRWWVRTARWGVVLGCSDEGVNLPDYWETLNLPELTLQAKQFEP